MVVGMLLAALATALLADARPVSSAGALSIDTNPTWSPDGNSVAFADADASNYRIVTAPVSGGGSIRTVYSASNADGCCDPMLWSATGRILFDSNFTLMSVRSSGGKATPLANNISWFILSPNGATAAFDDAGQSATGIGLVDLSGGKPRSVLRPTTASDSVAGFSPDGTELVFGRGSATGGSTIMVEHVGGGDPVPLGESALIGASRLPAGAVDVQWSPDGRWIAFVHLGKLEVVRTAGGAPHVLAGWLWGGFSWSPNSKLLACLCGPNREHLRLTAISPQTTRRTILWANRSLHYLSEDSWDHPQWSPDGTKLAFLARVGPGYPAIQVWVVGADGAGLRRIA